jgi:hypothetical protein
LCLTVERRRKRGAWALNRVCASVHGAPVQRSSEAVIIEVMADAEDTLARLVGAAERIADALEYLVRASADGGPRARLAVARAPSDTSRLAPVNLTPDGKLFVQVQNTGDAETTLLKPDVQVGEVQAVGGIIDRNSRAQASAPVPAAVAGPGVTVQFELGPQAHVLGGLPLVLRLPHRPGRFPGVTVLEVRMEPSGSSDGRPGWRQVDAQELPESHGAA